MQRRDLIRSSLIVAGAASVAGCFQQGETTAIDDGSFPAYEIPQYSQWVPAEGQTTGPGIFFTHMNWETYNNLGTDGDESDSETNESEQAGNESNTDDPIADILEQVPIVGLPMYSIVIGPYAALSILFYPFTEAIVPGNETSVDGIETTAMTWTGDNLLVFHGAYDPDVFAQRYTEGFEAADTRNGFTVYSGTDSLTENMAYAVSDETVVVGITPGDDEEYATDAVVSSALDRYMDALDRVVDTEDGHWLFETTGQAPLVVGYWNIDEFAMSDEPETGTNTTDAGADEGDAGPNLGATAVFDDAESLITTLTVEFDGDEIREMNARFSGLYPDGGVPSEDTIADELIGTEPVSRDIVIGDDRVHVAATFGEDVAADIPDEQ